MHVTLIRTDSLDIHILVEASAQDTKFSSVTIWSVTTTLESMHPSPIQIQWIVGGHGTFVAGVIGADGPLFTGVAPNATLGMFRVFGCVGGVNDDVLIAAFIRAHDSGGKNVDHFL